MSQPTAAPTRGGPHDRPWRAVGVRQGRGSEWLFLVDIGGQTVELTGRHLPSIPSLLIMNPDPDYWRALCPRPRGRMGIDVVAAAGLVVRECWAAQVRADEAKRAAELSTSVPKSVLTET